MRALPFAVAAIALCATIPAAQAQSTVSLSIAGEAFGGAPIFELRIGDLVLGQAAVDNAIDTVAEGRLFNTPTPRNYFQDITFDIPEGLFDAQATISIVLLNDRYEHVGYGHDRNLFIEFVDVNGLRVAGADISILEYGSVIVDVPLHDGLRPVYGSGQVAIAAPPEGGWPTFGMRSADVVAIAPMPPPRPDNNQ